MVCHIADRILVVYLCRSDGAHKLLPTIHSYRKMRKQPRKVHLLKKMQIACADYEIPLLLWYLRCC